MTNVEWKLNIKSDKRLSPDDLKSVLVLVSESIEMFGDCEGECQI